MHTEAPAPVPRFRRSRGIPAAVLIAMFVSIVVVFLQGGFTVRSADFGRVWPSTDSTKLDLDKMQQAK